MGLYISWMFFLFLVRGIFTENHKIRDWWQESQYSDDEMDTTDKKLSAYNQGVGGWLRPRWPGP